MSYDQQAIFVRFLLFFENEGGEQEGFFDTFLRYGLPVLGRREQQRT